ncbi:MAG: methylcrotonoyl-CoA carboxylase [Deltaproteobacteria bacterium]|nr:methylcrotonoyl-CoA carboxylase [Deltaproteobacteria bacterium]
MPTLTSQIRTSSPEFEARRAHMLALLETFEQRQRAARQAGGDRALAKLRKRGKLSPRERVERLLDRDGSFLELSTLAAFGQYDDEAPGAGVITGVGHVEGRLCVITANDHRVKGGAIYPASADKMIRAQQVAMENGLPAIALTESAGANLLHQAELFAMGTRGGRGFSNQARMSAAGTPQIAVVFGSSTAGGAYVPGMADINIQVRDKASVYLAGPPLVKAALGEDAEDAELGGAEMHASVSGLCDLLAEDDAHAIALARATVRMMHRSGHARPRRVARPPAYDPDELLGIVPADLRVPFDIREVICRLVDGATGGGAEFHEFRRDYGPELVCGTGWLDGHAVAVIGNNGPITSPAAQKAAHFIQWCNAQRTPILYLQNTVGYMVGIAAERGGIVKHGSAMVHAVSTATVPQFTVLVGGSYGAGNYGMCGRAFDPRLLLTWPCSKIGVMGGPQAARVMRIVQEAAIRRMGGEPEAADMEEMEALVIDEFDRTADPYYATSRLWDDGIIDPRDTRPALSVGLEAAWERDLAVVAEPRFGLLRQ